HASSFLFKDTQARLFNELGNKGDLSVQAFRPHSQLTCSLGIVNIIIIFGNILVVLAACTSAKLQTALTSTFVVSLATSDLLLGLLVLPFSIAYQVLLKHWIFSRWWCQIWLAVDVWTCTASILNLVVISLDRYLSLRHPLKYPKLMNRLHRTLKAGRRGVLASRESAAQHGELRIHRGGGGGGTSSGAANYSGGAGVSIVSRRVRLVKNSQQQQQQQQNLQVPPAANTSRKASWNTLINVATKYAPFSGRYGRELKAARMLAIICVTFIGCWAPFFSVYFALNPFIYALFSADYRRAFKTLVLRRQRRAYQTIRRLARGGLRGIEVVTAAQATATASFSLAGKSS
uniref:G_PROTEIN_RECEP_F1_2 domain-containing protein n=1 Tax=Macrostomum lignano TaxID=282301 RepID=A0A1I8I2X6_9PLAT